MTGAVSTPSRPAKAKQSTRNTKRRKGGNTANKEEDGESEHIGEKRVKEEDDSMSMAESSTPATQEQETKSKATVEESMKARDATPSPSTTSQKQRSDGESVVSEETTVTSTGVNETGTVRNVQPPSSSSAPTNAQSSSTFTVAKTPSKDGGADVSDDAASVTWSARTTRKRKSEDERIAWFKKDQTCEKLEPHRAFCGFCGKWVDLHPRLRYVMKPWIAHQRNCYMEITLENTQSVVVPGNNPPTQAVLGKPLVDRGRSSQAEMSNVHPPSLDGQQSKKSQTKTPTPPVKSAQEAVVRPAVTPWENAIPIFLENKYTGPTPLPATPTPTPTALGKRKRYDDSDSEPERPFPRPRNSLYKPPAGNGLWQTLTAPIRSFFAGFLQGASG